MAVEGDDSGRLDDPADSEALIELTLRTYGQIGVLCTIAATAYFNWLEDIMDASG